MPFVTRRRFLLAAGAGGIAALNPASRPASASLSGDGCAELRAVERKTRALGSDIAITAFHQSEQVAEQAIEAAFSELETIANVMSLYRQDSEICRLNQTGALAHPHPYLVSVLRKAREVSARSGGAFDATVQPLWKSYAAAKRSGRPMRDEEIKAARGKVDWRNVEVDAKGVRLRGPGTAVTLNGIAQGFAADRLMSALRTAGVRHALVNTGEIGTMGRKSGNESWKAGIQHPRRPDAYVSLASLSGRCMATSGDYETTFSDDRANNHIFDPNTGRSPTKLSSVTVLAPTGVEADAYSTAVFVLGPERGLQLLREMPDVDALLVLKNGRIVATDGFPYAT